MLLLYTNAWIIFFLIDIDETFRMSRETRTTYMYTINVALDFPEWDNRLKKWHFNILIRHHICSYHYSSTEKVSIFSFFGMWPKLQS